MFIQATFSHSPALETLPVYDTGYHDATALDFLSADDCQVSLRWKFPALLNPVYLRKQERTFADFYDYQDVLVKPTGGRRDA